LQKDSRQGQFAGRRWSLLPSSARKNRLEEWSEATWFHPDASSLYCSDGKQVGEVWIGKEDVFSTGSPKAVSPGVPPSAPAFQSFASRDLIAEVSDIRKASEFL
jgi:hypothetical protein